MAYARVDIDLDEFDDDDVLDEVKSRCNRSNQTFRMAVIDLVNKKAIPISDLAGLSLLDKMKFEFLTDNLSKISLEKLESIIK